MNPRHIVILQDCLRPGGTERQSVWLAQTLQAEPYTARLVLFQAARDSECSSRFQRELPISGRPREREARDARKMRTLHSTDVLQSRPTPFSWYAPGLIRALRSVEADVVLCMGRNANAYGAWIRRRLPRVQVISTCRTSQSLPFLYRRGIRHSHRCVTNSNWAATRLVDLGLKAADEISVIPNALLRPELLDLDRSPSAIAAARRALDLPQNRSILCNIASFVPGKNKQGLLRAFARAQRTADAVLLLAGAGPELSACRTLAKKLNLEDRVRFLGHTESIAQILQSSDLFVSTALRDALPNALVEAQAAGLPVIACDTGGSAEAFLDGKSGWSVPGGDEGKFAEAIDTLLASPEKGQAFAAAARDHAREKFHPKTIAARYDALIRGLLNLPEV